MRDGRRSARTDLALLEGLVDLVQRAPEADVGAHLMQRGAQRGQRTQRIHVLLARVRLPSHLHAAHNEQ